MIPIPSAKQQRAVLIRHFLRRFLDSELIPRYADARVTLIQILALVSVPGLIIIVFLLRKYARLAPLAPAAAQIAALNEKCLFIYFSMVVIGFVAVLEWDSLFPDRRDHLILSPLPIQGMNLFLSKAASLCLFLTLFSIFVNLFPVLLYPLFASRGFLESIRFTLSHALSVFAGNAFIFFACVTLRGLLLNCLGHRLFLPVSRLVQLLLLVFLLSIFCLMPVVSVESLRQRPGFLSCFAPAWFLGLYETMRAGPSPEFLPLARRALCALGLASLGFVLSYVLAYKRQPQGTLEAGRAGSAAGSHMREFIPAVFHRCLLRESHERASFCFIAKTIARSQFHRNYLGAYLGVGLAFVVMGLITLITRHGFRAVYLVKSEVLSVPMVLSFFILVGLRVIFSLPSHPGANWIFRLADGSHDAGHMSGVRKAMFICGVFPLLVLLFPIYAGFWGWRTAGLHVAFCAAMSLLLIEALVWRLDRIPFTCSYMPGKANLKLWWWAYLLSFTNYAYTTIEFEQWLLRRPTRFVTFFAATVTLMAATALHRTRLAGKTSSLRYEAKAAPGAEPLTLSYKPF